MSARREMAERTERERAARLDRLIIDHRERAAIRAALAPNDLPPYTYQPRELDHDENT